MQVAVIKKKIFFVFLSFQGFPGSSDGKESPCNAGDPGSIPGSGRPTGEGIGCPLQYSWATLVAQLVRIHLQCREPGSDPSVGNISCRRERLPSPGCWPGEFQRLYSPWDLKELDNTKRLSLSLSESVQKIALVLCVPS